MVEEQEQIKAAEQIAMQCLKGDVLLNSDLELARRLSSENLMKAFVNVIFEKQVEINGDVNKKIELTAIADLNERKVEFAYRAMGLPSQVEERRVLKEFKKSIAKRYIR